MVGVMILKVFSNPDDYDFVFLCAVHMLNFLHKCQVNLQALNSSKSKGNIFQYPKTTEKKAAQKSAEKCIWNTREKLEECSTQCEMAYLSMIKYD